MAHSGDRGHIGVWRIYVHPSGTRWCIDDGDVSRYTVFRKIELNGHAEVRISDTGLPGPRYWVEIAGRLVIDGEIAVIWGEVHANQAQFI